MKLFKSLLVAPATLGLLAPMSVTANELNINDVSNYSSSEEVQNINEFNSKELAITNSRVDGLEARFNNFEASSFSETTSASFGSTFFVGTIDEGTDDGATTFTYNYTIGLTTSFTGDDSFDVAIDGGNSSDAVGAVFDADNTGDALVLDGVSYTFPVGGFTVLVGDGTGVDGLNTGACSYAAYTDQVSNCGVGSIGGQADSAVTASYDFGNGFTTAFGLGFASEGDGILTDEDASTLGMEVAYTADTYGLAFAYTDDDDGADADESYYSFSATYTPDAPYTLSAGYETDTDDADSLFLGVTTTAFGPGSTSLGAATQGIAEDHDDNYMYELSYSYGVNDFITITPGAFLIEAEGSDEVGVAVRTDFAF